MSENIHEESIEIQLGKSSKWATTYGDLMSSLMILFLMLFSFSVIGGIDGKVRLDQVQQAFGAEADSHLANTIQQMNIEADVAEEIKGFIDSNNLSSYAVVKVDEYRIKIMMTQAVMFRRGKADLLAPCKPVLDKLSTMLVKVNNQMIIEGHTDDIPIHGGSNFELSSLRALNVAQYFMSKGIAPDRISIAGYGPYRPVVENDSEENRSRNRRVEINIIREHSDLMEVY